MRDKTAAFPVGLHGMLLFALCWLTLPTLFAPLERLLVGAACLVPHAWATLFGQPAAAAPAAAQRRLAELAAELRQRLWDHDTRGPAALRALGEPVHCAVVALTRRGGGGLPSELRLDRTHAELAGCHVVVSKGEALVGFLVPPGVGPAIDDGPDDPARVVLTHHLAAPRLHAAVELPDGAGLRFVLRPAAIADPAPLCVDLWDDPYRAARLDRGGLPVRTRDLGVERSGVPAGLLVGTTRIWGYERDQGEDALTLGVFAAPAVEPTALSHVVVWRTPGDGTGDAPPALAAQRHAAIVHDLPGASHGRHLLVGSHPVADGAAVALDGVLLGTARGLAFGVGLVTSFAASRHRWSLLLLPDDPDAGPRELDAEVVHADGDEVWVRCRVGVAERLPAGHLFTGSNGPHCPAGLWIGRALPHRYERLLLQVTVPGDPGPHAVEVFAGREVP